MTGYGIGTLSHGSDKYNIEIKSVNARFLDIRFRGLQLDLSIQDEIRKIIEKSSELIKNGGKLILEIAYNQKKEVKKLLRKNNFYVNSVVKDFAQNDRCIISTKITN